MTRRRPTRRPGDGAAEIGLQPPEASAGPGLAKARASEVVKPQAPADASASYRVALPAFEGPLDLLLHLIQKHELDILDIPIGFVTEKYVEFILMMEQMNIDVAGEYLVMAATLAHIKSKMLLPTPPEDQDSTEEEEADPRAELVRRLLEYQKYKLAAEQLGTRSVLGRDVFVRGTSEAVADGPAPLASMSLFKLLDAFEVILKRVKLTERPRDRLRAHQHHRSNRSAERHPADAAVRVLRGTVCRRSQPGRLDRHVPGSARDDAPPHDSHQSRGSVRDHSHRACRPRRRTRHRARCRGHGSMTKRTTEDDEMPTDETDAHRSKASSEADPMPPCCRRPEEPGADPCRGGRRRGHAYLKGLIEALLFVAETPMPLKELARAAKIDKKRAGELIDELRGDFTRRGIQIHEVAGGYCLRSNPEYANYVRGHLSQRPVRLSRPQLETLAIVAYRQPITRPEVDDIRGVDSGPVLKGFTRT